MGNIGVVQVVVYRIVGGNIGTRQMMLDHGWQYAMVLPGTGSRLNTVMDDPTRMQFYYGFESKQSAKLPTQTDGSAFPERSPDSA